MMGLMGVGGVGSGVPYAVGGAPLAVGAGGVMGGAAGHAPAAPFAHGLHERPCNEQENRHPLSNKRMSSAAKRTAPKKPVAKKPVAKKPAVKKTANKQAAPRKKTTRARCEHNRRRDYCKDCGGSQM